MTALFLLLSLHVDDFDDDEDDDNDDSCVIYSYCFSFYVYSVPPENIRKNE